jgi:MoxR-like ATPase
MTNARDKIVAAETALSQRFFERENLIRGLMIGLIYPRGGNLLVIGPPGSAKTAIAKALCRGIDGAEFFTRLVKKDAPPGDYFGKTNPAALTQGRWELELTGSVQNANVALLDEVYKGSATVLNRVLDLMEERVMDHDGRVFDLRGKLRLIIGCSNELPADPDVLRAFDDRWHWRVVADYLEQKDNFLAMLRGAVGSAASVYDQQALLTLNDLAIAEHEASATTVGEEILDLDWEIRNELLGKGMRPSDRKLARLPEVAKVYAYLDGSTTVEPEHIAACAECMLWLEPKQIPMIREVVGRLADPVGTKALEILDAAKAALSEYHTAFGTAVDRKGKMALGGECNAALIRARKELALLSGTASVTSQRKVQAAAAEIENYYVDVVTATRTLYGNKTYRDEVLRDMHEAMVKTDA